MASRKCTGRANKSGPKEPVKVFCRVKPMNHPDEISCVRIVSENTLVIEPPESAMNLRCNNRAIQTTFSKVFGPTASQAEVFNTVALPLVQDLVKGKNGLLFTYGVTGSGKTYTMCGTPYDAGIMQRSLDTLFNTIANCQAKKFIFKPDKLNGFDIQEEADAMLDRQHELHAGLTTFHNIKSKTTSQKQNYESDNNIERMVHTEDVPSISIDEDNAYAVFVSYVEIYNNSVYDLLEEDESKGKVLQSKIIREDGNRNMYIHGGTEVEVKSSEEAFEIFQRGQRRRRIAYTNLNAESSRSHTVFTIRLLQAPLDNQGEQIVLDKKFICISQLSLVDLAGSERSNRSKNTGQRLREAGNINNSLMTLRSCLEILRENQTQGTSKLVPYRESKLTHLFKHFFDADGSVRMVVCANPSVDDYDETTQVMKFAEVSQEVQVINTNPLKVDLGYTPGRRQANKLFKEAKTRLEKAGNADAADLDVDVGLVYSLGGPFPDSELSNPYNDEIITTLMRFLEQRIQKRNILREDLHQKQKDFRNMLLKVDRENVTLKIENASLKAVNDQQKKELSALETHICKAESQVDTLLHRLNKANEAIRQLQQEVKNKDMVINQRAIDKQRVKSRYNIKMQEESEKMSKELEVKLRQQRELLQNQMKEQENKLKLVKHILENDKENADSGTQVEKSSTTSSVDTRSTEISKPVETRPQERETTVSIPMKPQEREKKVSTSMKPQERGTKVSTPMKPLVVSEKDAGKKLEADVDLNTKGLVERIPVVNLRYRRSRSADRWIDHRPPGLVPVGTILQPKMHNKRSVTQLTDPKDFTDRGTRYCLVAQEQDTDGELETKLYKGDILPTSGGGAQVIFNDMEHLTQESPVSRKRGGHRSPEKKDSVVRNEQTLLQEHSKKPRV